MQRVEVRYHDVRRRTYHGSLHNAGVDCSKTRNYSKMSGDVFSVSDRNRNRKLQFSKASLKSQAQGTSLFTSAASNQRGFLIVRGRLRSGCQRVRECVKSERFSKE